MNHKEETVFERVFTAVIGDAEKVKESAESHVSQIRWRWAQGLQAVSVSMASSAVPGVSLALTLPSLVFTYRKMAHTAWGIGYHLGVKLDPLDDILRITELWATKSGRDLSAAGAPLVRAGLGVGLTLSSELLVKLLTTKLEAPLLETVKHNLKGLSTLFVSKVNEEASKQGISRAIPFVAPVVSGALTARMMYNFGQCATIYYESR
ncbi:hypothetical protein V5P93_000281 [Actinokineospora auranticolor]|uniref:hypothetical protein n=1 Tax=Actinokineospora auranticolor TaxID=155976 RepID=UPI0011B08674|nr:hypothetical protein [Actinokineospora auranticolor]